MSGFKPNKVADKADLSRLSQAALIGQFREFLRQANEAGAGLSTDLQGWLRLWEYSHIVLWTGAMAGDSVLDIGCRDSAFPWFLSSRGCAVSVVDPWEGLAAHVQRVGRALGLGIFDLCSRAESAAFPDASFDVIFSVSVIEHMAPTEVDQLVANVRRWLKPGGRFGLTFDYGREARTATLMPGPEAVEGLIRRVGLPSVPGRFDAAPTIPHTNPEYTFAAVLFMSEECDVAMSEFAGRGYPPNGIRVG